MIKQDNKQSPIYLVTPEKQQPTESDTVTGTQQEHQFSSDDDDPFPTAKTFETKAPKSIPKKLKFSSSQK